MALRVPLIAVMVHDVDLHQDGEAGVLPRRRDPELARHGDHELLALPIPVDGVDSQLLGLVLRSQNHRHVHEQQQHQSEYLLHTVGIIIKRI